MHWRQKVCRHFSMRGSWNRLEQTVHFAVLGLAIAE
ncbi:hypothetical protein GBAR_LOCUS3232 [Geodia barretti]|uniref:Uncharacterized protein n=1 Tax=Geodia barretti TaxID=519541 RepID=A0AA35R2G5_GEOBA|nr:hypothetical protein GBAR_LOCUS3232 [Geodia barretti]